MFEEAITEAKDEGNLFNVARKAVGTRTRKSPPAGCVDGVVRKQGQSGGASKDYKRNGKVVRTSNPCYVQEVHGPTDFAPKAELNGQNGDGIYAMTDGVSDEMFEEAITEAKDEGNLFNVARKAVGARKSPPAGCVDGLVRKKGQAEGTVAKRGGKRSKEGDSVFCPKDFATRQDLSPGSSGVSIYALADNVSDEQFEEAITEAKDEGNLFNVARKAVGARKSPPAGCVDGWRAIP